MNELLTKKCVPCKKGAPRLTPDELAAMRPEIPDWEVREKDGVQKLHKAPSRGGGQKTILLLGLQV